MINNFLRNFFDNARMPNGFLGACILKVMNGFGHKYLAEWAFTFIDIQNGDSILDIGCGGGGNIARLLRLYPASTVNGVDYSPTSISLAKKCNKKGINEKRCEIRLGNVEQLCYDAESYDAVTAFETVYYWENIKQAFKEVHRVLKHSGRFIIVNGANADGKWIWDAYIDGMHTYSSSELELLLTDTGFENIKIMKKAGCDFLGIVAYKK